MYSREAYEAYAASQNAATPDSGSSKKVNTSNSKGHSKSVNPRDSVSKRDLVLFHLLQEIQDFRDIQEYAPPLNTSEASKAEAHTRHITRKARKAYDSALITWRTSAAEMAFAAHEDMIKAKQVLTQARDLASEAYQVAKRFKDSPPEHSS
jgi:hypothetical protein